MNKPIFDDSEPKLAKFTLGGKPGPWSFPGWDAIVQLIVSFDFNEEDLKVTDKEVLDKQDDE